MVDAWSGCAALLRCGAHICADQSSDPKGYGNHQIRALSAGRRAGPEMEKLLSDSKLHAVVKRNSLFDVASSQYVSKINEFRLNGPSGQSFDQRHVVVSAQYIRLPTHINTLNSGVRIGNKIFAVKVDCDNSESRLFSSKSIYAAHLSRPPKPPAAGRPPCALGIAAVEARHGCARRSGIELHADALPIAPDHLAELVEKKPPRNQAKPVRRRRVGIHLDHRPVSVDVPHEAVATSWRAAEKEFPPLQRTGT
jgi:hypothetical protein